MRLRALLLLLFSTGCVSAAWSQETSATAMRKRRAVSPAPRLEIFVNPSDSRVVSFATSNGPLTVHGTKDMQGRATRFTLVESSTGQLILRANGQPGMFRANDGTTVQFDFAGDPVRLLITATDGRRFEVADGKVTQLDPLVGAHRVAESRHDVISTNDGGLTGTVTRTCDGKALPVAGATVFGRYHLQGGTTCPSPSFTTTTGADGGFAVPVPVNSAASDTVSLICDLIPDLADVVCEWVPPDLEIEEKILTACPGLFTIPPPFGEALVTACVGAVTAWTVTCNLSEGCDRYQQIATDYYRANCRTEGSSVVVSASHPDFGTATTSGQIPVAVTIALPTPNCDNTRERHYLEGKVNQDYTWRNVATCEGVVQSDTGGTYTDTVDWIRFSVAKKLQGQWVRGTCKREEVITNEAGTTSSSWSYTYDYPMFSETLERHSRSEFGSEDLTVTHNVHIPSGTMRGISQRHIFSNVPDCGEKRGTRGTYTSTSTLIRHARYQASKTVDQLPADFTEPLEKGICSADFIWIPH